jgi:hypothetical protein
MPTLEGEHHFYFKMGGEGKMQPYLRQLIHSTGERHLNV